MMKIIAILSVFVLTIFSACNAVIIKGALPLNSGTFDKAS